MEEPPKMFEEPISDKKENQEKKSAKVEMPDHLVPTKKEVEEKRSWLKKPYDVWREND
jgi:hypothetical protein